MLELYHHLTLTGDLNKVKSEITLGDKSNPPLFMGDNKLCKRSQEIYEEVQKHQIIAILEIV